MTPVNAAGLVPFEVEASIARCGGAQCPCILLMDHPLGSAFEHPKVHTSVKSRPSPE